MATKQIGTATEVITLAEARSHLRLVAFGSPLAHPEDANILKWITSARQWAESYLERAIGTQTLETALDQFPAEFKLTPNVQSVTSITYVDVDGVTQTIAPADYVLDNYSTPSCVFPAFGKVWPQTQQSPNAVKIRYVAGYDVSNPCPETIISAMKLYIGHLYVNRQEDVLGNTRISFNSLPMGVYSMLQPYRLNVGL